MVASAPATDFDWLFHPPAWVTWLSLVGGLGAFGWKLWEHSVGRRDRSDDQQIARDAFWYESIVVPRVVEPLLDLMAKHQRALNKLLEKESTPEALEAYFRKYQKDQAQLVDGMSMLMVISEETYKEVAAHLDGLEDQLAVFCSKLRTSNKRGPPISAFSDAQNACLKGLMTLHLRLRRR